MIVRWTRTALANLNDLAEYIAQDNPRAAAHMVARILSSIEKLKAHPSIGRPGRVPNTRELVISGTPYIIPYRVKGSHIELLRFSMPHADGPPTSRRYSLQGRVWIAQCPLTTILPSGFFMSRTRGKTSIIINERTKKTSLKDSIEACLRSSW